MNRPRCGMLTIAVLSLNVRVPAQQVAGIARPGESTATPPTSTQAADFGPCSWVQVSAKAAFSPRDTAEDAVFAGKMWLSNGWRSPNVLTRDLWTSTDGATWTQVGADTPYDGYSEMVVYDDKLWAIKASVWNSTDGLKWTRILDRTPFGGRGYGEAVVFRDRIWQMGSGKDVWSTRDGVKWTCVTEQAPFGDRCASAVTAFGGRLWLIGGRTNAASNPPEKHYKEFTTHHDVWCSEDGANWARVLEHAPWAPRMWCVSAVYAGRLWLIGGFDNRNSRNLGDVWYTADGKDWRLLKADNPFAPRHEVTCYVYDGSLWVVAGNTWPVANDVWRLTLPNASREAAGHQGSSRR